MKDLNYKVESKLIKDIISGKFPNNHLPLIDEIASMLGVSRTVAREAIKKLESYGFIECKRGKPSVLKTSGMKGIS